VPRFGVWFCLSLLLWSSSAQAAAPTALLQRDWMVALVEGLGWSFGLPDEPGDDDYLRILSGERRYRYEAEALCNPEDRVSVKSFRTYGYCSGNAWLSGISTPTTAHLQLMVPISGSFEMSIRLRRAGHEIELEGKTYTAGAGEMFESVPLGTVELTAGLHELSLHLPPDGAVDYLELAAAQLTPIAPLEGWQPDTPLRRSDLAVTACQLLGLESLLLPRGQDYLFQAEKGKLFDGAAITAIRHLGEPSGGAWVRAGNLSGRVTLMLDVPGGVYRLVMRGMGDRPLALDIPGKLHRDELFRPYLEDTDLGAFYLEEPLRLTVGLPPRAGFDAVRLEAYRATPADFLRLTGLPAEDGPVEVQELDTLLALLGTLAEPR